MTDQTHAEKAREWIESADEARFQEDLAGADLCAQLANAEAHLAVAEQLRIGNLIALAESGRTTVNGARWALAQLYSGSAEEGSAHMAIHPEIARALGVEQ